MEAESRTKQKCAIVIPVYKESLTGDEAYSFSHSTYVFKDYPIYLLCPNNINLDFYRLSSKKSNLFTLSLKPDFFKNRTTYSQLLTMPAFWKAFDAFEYVLICQTDAFVFYDNLNEFIDMGYDYYGAPWENEKVGNGGFSLRKTEAMIRVTEKYGSTEDAEDIYFCYTHGDELNICPKDVARRFSIEIEPSRYFKENDWKLPMASHQLRRFICLDIINER